MFSLVNVDASFLSLILESFSAIIPIYAEIFILPRKLKEYKKHKKLDKYKEHFRSVQLLIFFYLLSVSLLLRLYPYFFSAVEIIKPLPDLILILLLVYTVTIPLRGFEYDTFTKKGIIVGKSKIDFYLMMSMVSLPLVLFFLSQTGEVGKGLGVLFDAPISLTVAFSTATLIYLYKRTFKLN